MFTGSPKLARAICKSISSCPPSRPVLAALLASFAAPTIGVAAPLIIEEAARIAAPDPQYTIDMIGSWDYSLYSSRIAVFGDELILSGIDFNEEDGDYYQHAAWTFKRNSSGAWQYTSTLDTVRDGMEIYWGTPMALALEGDLAVAGGIFERTATGWLRRADFYHGPDAEISNGLIVDSSDAGNGWSAELYAKGTSGEWQRTDTVSVPDVFKYGDGEYHGYDVDISGGQLIIAAPSDDDESPGEPGAHVFEGGPGAWARTAMLPAAGGGPVAIRNGTAIAGSRVFNKSGGVWSYTSELHMPDVKTRGAGTLAKLGDDLLVMSHPQDNLRGKRGGSLSVWQRNSAGTFREVARLVASDSKDAYQLGYDVDMHGRRVVATAEGAAYVFDLPQDFSQPDLIQDDFQDGDSAQWTPTTGSFSVTNNGSTLVYRQTSLTGDAASFLSASDWKNQSIQVDVKPTAFNGPDRWFGLAARRSDANNYYYVTVRQSNVVQLKKMVNGAYQTLASAPLPVTLNRTYRLRFEAIGTRLRAYVDNTLVVEASDNTLTHGSAGLMMYRTSADYDNVIVSPSPQLRLFDDNFDDRFWQPTWWSHTGAGTWSRVMDGSYVFAQANSAATGVRAIAGVNAEDQSVQTRVQPTAFANSNNAWFGLITRYVDEGNYYYVTVRRNNIISLRRLVNGAIQELDVAAMTVNAGQWYTLRMEAIGDSLRVFVDGKLQLEAQDSTFASGRYGLMTNLAAARYDDVIVAQ